jgi:hypothetical protein
VRIAAGHIRKLAFRNRCLGRAAFHENVSQESNGDAARLLEIGPSELTNHDKAVSKLVGEQAIR